MKPYKEKGVKKKNVMKARRKFREAPYNATIDGKLGMTNCLKKTVIKIYTNLTIIVGQGIEAALPLHVFLIS